MDYSELIEWYALDSIDPYGNLRDDYRNAYLCDVLAKLNGNKNTSPSDFLISFETKQSDKPDWQVQKEKLNIFAKTHPSKVIDKRKN